MLSIADLRVSHGPRAVLNGIHLKSTSKGLTLLRGENGAGKSTLLRCIAGLHSYSGRITWNGRDLKPSERLVYPVFDTASLYDRLTGRQNITVLSDGIPRPEETAATGLVSSHLLKRRVQGYSHGERARLCLTMAFGSGAELLLLDEPTNGLDSKARARVKEILGARKVSTKLIMVAHDDADYFRDIVDEELVLDSGALCPA